MGCCDTNGLMSIPDAIKHLLAHTSTVTQTETLSLLNAQDRILATDIHAPISIPPFANSAMDGYALRLSDLQPNTPLVLAGTAFAGKGYQGELPAQSCIRIMTGAPIPKGADTVVMQEQTEVETQNNTKFVHFKASAKLGQHIRAVGDDLLKDETVLTKGSKLTTRDIPLLATLGIVKVTVYRKPKVAFFSTGDELKPLGTTLGAGHIYDSNRYTLHAMLAKMQCEPIDLGVVKDDPDALRDTLEFASQKADLILSSGGVSVGDADFVKASLDAAGEIGFWKIAIKPGKPFAFGKINNALFCGLPGNPVSVSVTLHVFVAPLIAKMAGFVKWQPTIQLKAKAKTPFAKSPGRTDYQRGIYHSDEHGNLWVTTTGNQGSGAFSSLSKANCFVILEQERANVAAGESVTIEPFNNLLT